MSCLNLNYLVYAYQFPQSLKESSFVTFEINFKRDHELTRTVVSDTQGRIGDWEIIWADAEFLRFEVRIVSIFGAFSIFGENFYLISTHFLVFKNES